MPVSVDTSSYPTTPTKLDPFGTVNQLLTAQQAQQNIQTSGIENQLLARRLGGQQALADAYSGNIDPTTGLLDSAGVARNLAASPYGEQIPGAVGASQGIYGTNTTNNTAAEGLNATEAARVNARLTGRLTSNDGVDFSGAMGDLSDLLATRQISPQTFQAYRNQFARNKGDLTNFVTGLANASNPNAAMGDATLATTAAGTRVGTAGQKFAMSVHGYGAPGSGQPGPMPAGMSTTNPPAPSQASPSQATSPQSGPGYLSTPPAGYLDAQAAVAKQSGDSLAADQALAKTYKQRVFPLEQAIPLLDSLGPSSQGIIGQRKADFQNLYQSITGESSPDDMGVAQNKLKKYLTQYVNQNGNGSTLGQFASSVAGSPNTDMANLAATDVAKMALGVQRMQQAQVAGYSGPASGYANYAKTFGQNQDPRAYAFDLLPQAEQDRLSSSLKGPERTKFLASLKTAVGDGQNGVTPLKPRQPAQPQGQQQ